MTNIEEIKNKYEAIEGWYDLYNLDDTLFRYFEVEREKDLPKIYQKLNRFSPHIVETPRGWFTQKVPIVIMANPIRNCHLNIPNYRADFWSDVNWNTVFKALEGFYKSLYQPRRRDPLVIDRVLNGIPKNYLSWGAFKSLSHWWPNEDDPRSQIRLHPLFYFVQQNGSWKIGGNRNEIYRYNPNIAESRRVEISNILKALILRDGSFIRTRGGLDVERFLRDSFLTADKIEEIKGIFKE